MCRGADQKEFRTVIRKKTNLKIQETKKDKSKDIRNKKRRSFTTASFFISSLFDLLHRVNQAFECFRIVHGQISQYFTVQFNSFFLQAIDKS